MMPVQLHGALAEVLELSSPKGAPWEFLVIFATLLLGPAIVERARVPGLIGLLLGGYAIGPHGLDLIGPGNTTVPDLGQLGLLYLMFVAGVELDLNLLRKYRRSAVVFGLLTFLLPMAFGTTVGLGLGWQVLAAILLGSLLASHTLITYPTVRDAGLASDPAVATVVGSTVLTDTLTLVVLAAVAGAVGGGRSTIDVAVQIVVGLTVLIAFSMLLLPLLAGWAFQLFGAERAVRYIVAITAFLAAATVAEVFGIEGIVGAFFAGLALNRLVPNEGQLMDRIGFFGGAVFIPVFLVSIGLILDPAVIVKGETLGLAGLFILACLGGKGLAAAVSARLLGFSRPQAGLLFSLSAAQAAATLAATVVGFQLGLFSSAVVNAVLVLIFASVLVSTVVGARASAAMATHEDRVRPMGARVVVGVGDPASAAGALSIAVRIARADGGSCSPCWSCRSRLRSRLVPRTAVCGTPRRRPESMAWSRRWWIARCCMARCMPGWRRKPRSCSSPSPPRWTRLGSRPPARLWLRGCRALCRLRSYAGAPRVLGLCERSRAARMGRTRIRCSAICPSASPVELRIGCRRATATGRRWWQRTM